MFSKSSRDQIEAIGRMSEEELKEHCKACAKWAQNMSKELKTYSKH